VPSRLRVGVEAFGAEKLQSGTQKAPQPTAMIVIIESAQAEKNQLS